MIDSEIYSGNTISDILLNLPTDLPVKIEIGNEEEDAHPGEDLSDKMFECGGCDETFHDQDELFCHQILHTVENCLEFEVASENFPNETKPECNIINIKQETCYDDNSSGEIFECEICRETFICGSDLTAHLQLHTNASPLATGTHLRTFTVTVNQKGLSIIEEPLSDNTTCNEKVDKRDLPACTRSILRTEVSSDLQSDTSPESSEKIPSPPFKCETCYKTFPLKRNLMGHLKIHSGVKAFECKVCHKKFVRRYSLTRHLQLHSDANLLNYRTLHENVKERNVQLAGGDLSAPPHADINIKGESLECESSQDMVCSKMKLLGCAEPVQCKTSLSFSSDDSPRHTEQMDNGIQMVRQKPFKCRQCNASLATKHSLTRHLKIHSGRKTFECKVCHKNFGRSHDLVRHSWLHSRKEPLSSDTCRANSGCDVQVNKPEINVKMEDPSECKPIQDILHNKTNLLQNVKLVQSNEIHLGLSSNNNPKVAEQITLLVQQNSIKCEKCNATFTLKKSLTRHLKIHSRTETFDCKICHKIFSCKYNLTRHSYSHKTNKSVKSEMHNEHSNNDFENNKNENCINENMLKCETSADDPFQINGLVKAELLPYNQTLSDAQSVVDQKTSEKTPSHPFEAYCKLCTRTFASKSSLTRHLRTHTDLKPFVCTICHVAYRNKYDLTRHVGSHAGGKLFECKTCKETFSSGPALIDHLRTHRQSGKFECLVCHENFAEVELLIGHMPTHAKENKFKCDVCHKTFTEHSYLSRHMKVHSGNRPFECKVCHKTFGHSQNLKAHLKVHTQEKAFECEICSKCFAERGTLTKHLKRHADDTTLICDICHKIFMYKGNLIGHMKTIHGGEKRLNLKCETCHKTFAEKWKYESHIKIHLKLARFECEICHKTFTTQGALVTHTKNIHFDRKTYECEVCHKPFSTKSSRATHLKTHTGEKPFECEICGNTFAQRHHLGNHIRIHTGEKPFECTVCLKTFTLKAHLRAHEKTHLRKAQ